MKSAQISLNTLWRVLGTGYCFCFLFVGGFILSLTALPLTRLIGCTPAEKDVRARRLIHHSFRFYLWQMQALGLMTLAVHGKDNLQFAQGRLVIANHPSLLDVVILISLMPDCDCVVKADLRHSLVRGVIRAAGYTDNRDGDTMLNRCRTTLAQNQPLIVFPEGTRSTPGQPLVFQRGSANIAVRCQADILPVLITCDPPTLLKGEPWYKIPREKPQFSVVILPPIAVNQLIRQDQPASLATRNLNRHLLEMYNERLNHPESNTHV